MEILNIVQHSFTAPYVHYEGQMSPPANEFYIHYPYVTLELVPKYSDSLDRAQLLTKSYAYKATWIDEQHEIHQNKNRGESRCSRRVSSSYF
jgi:hypothetical protein